MRAWHRCTRTPVTSTRLPSVPPTLVGHLLLHVGNLTTAPPPPPFLGRPHVVVHVRIATLHCHSMPTRSCQILRRQGLFVPSFCIHNPPSSPASIRLRKAAVEPRPAPPHSPLLACHAEAHPCQLAMRWRGKGIGPSESFVRLWGRRGREEIRHTDKWVPSAVHF
jgi:hypothetical protein